MGPAGPARSVVGMNEGHARLCSSPEWAAHIQGEILPSLTRHADLGADMIEIGPGPGAATEWLRHRVRRLTAQEVDPAAAAALAGKYPGGNVAVVAGDAADLSFPDESFDSAGSFTMLHHVPTVALQDRLFAEVARVLRPGGVFVLGDSLASPDLEAHHEGDTYNPVDPDRLAKRLSQAGFGQAQVKTNPFGWAAQARKP